MEWNVQVWVESSWSLGRSALGQSSVLVLGHRGLVLVVVSVMGKRRHQRGESLPVRFSHRDEAQCEFRCVESMMETDDRTKKRTWPKLCCLASCLFYRPGNFSVIACHCHFTNTALYGTAPYTDDHRHPADIGQRLAR